ncbi:MAG: FG-GAP repeat protein [Planctomycetes bacterium]|nr:FG-GAP repeat protein [Planctomycetota bacterium]
MFSMRSYLALLAVLAPSSLLSAQSLLFHVDGYSASDDFGTSVAPVGDVNGDGRLDFLVGAPREFGAGTARLLSGIGGAELQRFTGSNIDDRFGHAVAGAGDVDGDGVPDIVVGAPDADSGGTESGLIRVFSGRSYAEIRTIDGQTPNDFFGRAVDGGHDANGDGFDDLLVGAPGEFGTGTAYAISGRDGATIWRWNGDAIGDEFGGSVAFAGDVDGDGYADAAIGAHLNDSGGTDSGRVRVFSGRTGSELYTVDGSTFDDRFGFCVRAAGDVDRDGIPDLIVGAPIEFGVGTVYLLAGRTGAVLRRLTGDDLGDRFGHAVSALGDLDLDGYADYVVGAPEDDNNGAQSGSVRVFSGRLGLELRTWNGAAADDQFGFDVAGVDVDDDGFADIVAGVPFSDVGGPESGRVSVYDLGRTGVPARVEFFGNACAGSNGHLPRIDHRGRPVLGRSMDLLLRGARASSPALLSLGMRQDFPLDGLGFTGCRSLALIGGTFLSSATNANGMAALNGIPVPAAPYLVGAAVACQWVVIDLGANAGGATASNGLELVLGS